LPLNSSYTFTVTATDSDGQPVAGAAVALTVVGPNAATTTITTGADGKATYSYTGVNAGTDYAQAVLAAQPSVASNTASVVWIEPVQSVSTTTIHGRFFTNNYWGDPFLATPASTPVFEQDFPTVNFDPVAGTVANNASGVNEWTRPFTDITTDLAGNYTGTIVAAGNGQQAGSGNLGSFDAVFTGSYTIGSAGDYTFDVLSDDGFIFGIGDGATALAGNVMYNAPASGLTAFESYPIMGTFNHNTGPQPYSIKVHFPAPGVYHYEVDYDETWGASLCLTVRLHSTGEGVTPTGTLALSPTLTSAGAINTSKTYTVSVMDAAGAPIANLPVKLDISGANTGQVPATTDARGLASFTYVGSNTGTDQLQAYAILDGMPALSNTVGQSWVEAGAAAPPVIGSVTPVDGAEITAPTPITASFTPPTGQTITSWQVSYGRSGNSGAPVVLGSGTGAPPATLATFDPTILANGVYTITLTAYASGGVGQSSSVDVIVDGNLKLGRYQVTYQDANVPVGGIPIQVQRTYDSFDKSTGAFGVGWQLGVANFRVYTDGPLGAGGWSQYATSCFLAGLGGGLCQMAWATSRPHYVTVVWPDGHTETFDFTPTAGSNLFWFGSAAFTARSGSTSTLAVVGDGSLSYSGDGNLYGSIGGPLFNPTRFTLTAKDGTVYVLDTASGLVSETDRNGNTVTVDAAGIHSSLGPSLTFVRDGSGRITELDEPGGAKVTYAYNAAGDLASVTDERGSTVTYQYDANHNLTKTIDPAAHPLRTLTYGTDGRLQTVTDADGNTTSISSDPSALQQVVGDPNGQLTTINSFDANGNLVEVSQVFGGQTLSTTRHYDAYGRVTDLTDPLGNHSQWTYDEGGGPSNGNLLSYTDASGYTLTFGNYDAFGQAGSVAGPDGSVLQTSTYDPKTGLLLSTQRPGQPPTTYTYYANGLKHTTNNGSGMTMTYGYDSTGHLTNETDANGRTTTYGFNAAGQLASVTDQSGNTTNYTYDAHGSLTSVQNADGVVYSYGYDDRNRLISTGDPSHSTTYTYDDQGRVQQRTDRNGQVTTFAYDSHSQVTQEIRPGNDITRFTYDPLERLIEADNASSEVTFAYDNAGRVVEQVTCAPEPNGAPCQPSDSSSALPTVKIDYTWDKDGHQTSVSDPAGKTSYGFDANGLLGTITDPSGGTFGFAYDADSRPVTMSIPNGIVVTTKYDSSGLPVAIDSKLGSAAVDQEDYTLDPATGQRVSLSDAGGTQTYTYQANGALSASISNGQPSNAYTWDAAGNITSLPGIAAASISYDSSGRLHSAGSLQYAYDAEGDLIGRTDTATGAWTHYTWNADHQLTSVDGSDGSHGTYKYDPLGRRVESNQSGNVTRYAWDAFNLVAEYNGSNALVASYVNGPTNASVYDATTPAEVLESTRWGSTLYYLHDARGSTVAATRSDGSVAYRNSYSAFGVPTLGDPSDAAYAYAGAQFDTATGLYYMRDRYYDPSIGRFISEDPQAADCYALPLGSWTHYGQSLNLRTPLALNRYTYAGADPIDYLDPSGDFGLPAIGLQVGRAIGCALVCGVLFISSQYMSYSTTIHSPTAQEQGDEILDCAQDYPQLMEDEAVAQDGMGLETALGTPAGDMASPFASEEIVDFIAIYFDSDTGTLLIYSGEASVVFFEEG
jgi:RHS repeat-associated protein